MRHTTVYLKIHDARSLQPRFQGPFLIIDRPTNSTINIKVGTYADGRDRVKEHHWKNCRPALVVPNTPIASRPKLGRPSKTSTPVAVSNTTETPTNRFPDPPPSFSTVDKSKQPLTSSAAANKDAIHRVSDHATSIPESRVPASADVGGSSRPTRSTRNPNPVYIDEISLTGPPHFKPFISRKPWSASAAEVDELNRTISQGLGSKP